VKLLELTEGQTTLLVPDFKAFKGPGSSKVPVFYNPNMEFNRDVTIPVFEAHLGKKKVEILDGLAGTGARGIRLSNEVDGNFKTLLIDKNRLAKELIEKNVKLNDLEEIEVMNKDLNILLSEKNFDYIDIDPFGSPVKFLDAAFRSIRNNGLVAVTATDTAPLCGTYPKVTMRRYGAQIVKTSYCHEVGLRILLGYCAREALKYDMAVEPLLVHYSDHYYRIYLTVKKGAKRADKSLRNLGYIQHEPETKNRIILSLKDPAPKSLGPLWIGNLYDKAFLKKIKPDKPLGTTKRLMKYLRLWLEEAEAPPTYYDVNEVASINRSSPPKVDWMLERLRDNGFFASKTHFSPTAFKTDANTQEILSFLK
jgi:tRNA (guanine26-N2/guanine27-N2)-dimethyltransferase